MEITINLAREPFVDLRPILKWLRNAIGVLAFLSLVLLTLVFVVHRKIGEARNYIRSLEDRLSLVRRERQDYEAAFHSPDSAKILTQTKALNQIVDAKALSWTLVMQELEGVLPSGVQVSAVEPTRAKDGSITLRLRVQGPRDKSIDLVRHLELSGRFLSPRIVDESASINGDAAQKSAPPGASRITQFDLLAGYDESSSDGTGAVSPGDESADTGSSHTALDRHNEAPPDATGRNADRLRAQSLGSPGGER